jgi:hypothetical protein
MDVHAWLRTIPPIDQYADVFLRNEINGATLLEITLEDLDYMEIKVLMHRKLILKNAEEFRKSQQGESRALPQPPLHQQRAGRTSNGSVDEKEQQYSTVRSSGLLC